MATKINTNLLSIRNNIVPFNLLNRYGHTMSGSEKKQCLDKKLTYDEWLKFEKKDLIKKYLDYVNLFYIANRKLPLQQQMIDLYNETIFFDVNFGFIGYLGDTFYNADKSERLEESIIFMNYVKRLLSGKDIKFNNYVIDIFERTNEGLYVIGAYHFSTTRIPISTISQLKKLTLKAELEQGLKKNNNKVEKRLKI